jgi:hypothetical protein
VINDDYTPEEDELLRKLVEKCGEGNWAKIASYLEGRTDASVRTRWKFLTLGETVLTICTLLYLFNRHLFFFLSCSLKRSETIETENCFRKTKITSKQTPEVCSEDFSIPFRIY